MNVDKRSRAMNAYVRSTKTYADIASEFEVSERTVIRWAKADNWIEKRRLFLAKGGLPATVATARTDSIDYRALAHAAIEALGKAAEGCEVKSMESAYRTQLAFIEFMRKQDPMTAKELTEIAIANGLNLTVILAELAAYEKLYAENHQG